MESESISYEIERKFLVKELPENLEKYPKCEIEQGYLCTEPVVRVRKMDDEYILTYKSGGLMIREEYEHKLGKKGYEHLIQKADGTVISKIRYKIDDGNGHVIELDVFQGKLKGFVMAEVEFVSREDATDYVVPDWFAEEVTDTPMFHNSRISKMSEEETEEFMKKIRMN
ncbi:MAG: CYTH domain-containing protein [Lachnospiraceae bacterium]|nr:CYTH domain-containing protein [Lachnospiraceae bacterium]